jgi:hypothetical protein
LILRQTSFTGAVMDPDVLDIHESQQYSRLSSHKSIILKGKERL